MRHSRSFKKKDINLENDNDKERCLEFSEEDLKELLKYLEDICFPHGTFTVDELADLSNEEIIKILFKNSKTL